MKLKDILDKTEKIELVLLDKEKYNLLDDIKRGEKLNFIDSFGYKYSYDSSQIYDLYNNRYKKSIVNEKNPFTIYNIQKYIDNNKGNCKVLSTSWTKANEKIKLQCSCGRIYEARWYHIYANHKFQCNKCGYSNPYNKKSIDESEKICIKHGYHIIKDTYKNKKNFDMYDKLGYKYSNCSVYSLNNRTNKTNRFCYNNKYQIENMLLYFDMNNIPIRFVDKNLKNVKSNDYIECYCSECGNIYKATWEQMRFNNKSLPRTRCEKCSDYESNLEYKVEEYLKERNIKYEYQKRFNDCKNKRTLPFDFYLIDYNCVIEVNGSQHYYKNHFFNETLEHRKKIDNIKKEYCIKKEINFVEIPFWLINSNTETYKKIIDNIIS